MHGPENLVRRANGKGKIKSWSRRENTERLAPKSRRRSAPIKHEHLMFRVIDLPTEVDLSKSKATFRDGTFEVMMPKAAPAESLRVETKPELSVEADTSVHETGEIEAASTPPLAPEANEPNVKAQAASSRK